MVRINYIFLRGTVVIASAILIAMAMIWYLDSKSNVVPKHTTDRSQQKFTPSRAASVRGDRLVRHDKIEGFAVVKTRLESTQPGEFEEIWESIAEFSGSLDEKRDLMELAIWRMCAAGEVDNAVKCVLKYIGPGKLRNVLLQSIFSNPQVPLSQLCASQQILQNAEDRVVAARGISSAIASLNNLTKADVQNLMGLGSDWKTTLMTGLRQHVAGVKYIHGDLILAIRDVVNTAKIADSLSPSEIAMVGDVFMQIAQEAPNEVWDVLHADGSNPVDQSLLIHVAECMAKIDSAKAMSCVLNSGNPAGTGAVFTHWLQFDSYAANAWYDQHKQEFTQATNGQLIGAYAQDSIRTGNLDEARKWARTIVDVTQRKNIEGHIWNAERDSLRKEVGNDPTGTVQSIVSGQSHYADYWLEEAIGTWVAKDFDKAQDWYNQNWKSLPPSKSQYVAAAFATQALKQGDASTASQWAALIQDPKTKQRIQDRINKAGTEPKK